MNKLILLFSFISLISFSQSDEEIQSMLFKVSQKINESLPMTVDGDTRMDSTISLSNRTVQYNYTLVNAEKEYFDTTIVYKEFYPTLLNDIKTNPGLKPFRDINVTFVYNYRDKNGKFLLKYTFPPEKYKSVDSNQLSTINYNNDFNTKEFVDYVNLKDHPKAKGVNIKFRYPKSFERTEGARPNVVANFAHKTKNLRFNFVILNSPVYLSRKDVKELFEEDTDILAKELIEDIEAELISSKTIKIDNYQTLESIVKIKTEAITGETIITNGLIWNIFYEDSSIIIFGGSIDEDFEESKLLLRLIMNTITFEEQYDYAGSSRVYFNENFDEFVDKFFRELNYYGINKIRPKKINIKLLPFDQFKQTSHIHGASFGYNNDDIIDIVLNERSWNEFSKAQKHYLIFHELSHDILNLDDLDFRQNEKQIMYPSIGSFKYLTMDDFIDNFHSLLEDYSSVDSSETEDTNNTELTKDPLVSLEEMKNSLVKEHLLDVKNRLGSEEYSKLQKLYNLDEYAQCFAEKLLEKFNISELVNLSESDTKIAEDIMLSCFAENEITSLSVNKPTNTNDSFFKNGLEKNKSGDYTGAILDFDKAIEIDPNYASTYYNRGNSKYSLKDYYGAISDYNKAIQVDSTNVNAYNNRGISKKNLKDYSGAISDYNKAIELDPSNADAYYNRGNSKYSLKDYYGAISDYNKAIQIDPTNVKAYRGRGISKEYIGDLNGACIDWTKASELGDVDASGWIEKQCN